MTFSGFKHLVQGHVYYGDVVNRQFHRQSVFVNSSGHVYCYRPKMRRMVIAGILACLSLVAIGGEGAKAVEGTSLRDRLIGSILFHPERGISIRPDELGIQAEELRLRTEDGVSIHGFYLAAGKANRALLFLHGNAGNASHRLPNAHALRQLGIHVLLIDYRGYGLSEGSPSEPGLYADARAGLGYLGDTLSIPEQRIVVFGRSLGGAIASEVSQYRPLGGVILESSFASLFDVGVRTLLAPLAPLAIGRFDSASKLGNVRAPLLFFHGDRDEIVPYASGKRLFEAASEPKEFETISGAGHNNTVEVGGTEYFERIRSFLNRVVPVSVSEEGD